MDDQSFESTQVPDRRTFFKRFVTGLGAAIGAILNGTGKRSGLFGRASKSTLDGAPTTH